MCMQTLTCKRHQQVDSHAESPRQKSLATRLLHPPKVTQDPYGAVAPPLYQTATFDQVSAVQCGPYDYTRSGNPTRDQLEAQMADLEVLLFPGLAHVLFPSAGTSFQCCNLCRRQRVSCV